MTNKSLIRSKPSTLVKTEPAVDVEFSSNMVEKPVNVSKFDRFTPKTMGISFASAPIGIYALTGLGIIQAAPGWEQRGLIISAIATFMGAGLIKYWGKEVQTLNAYNVLADFPLDEDRIAAYSAIKNIRKGKNLINSFHVYDDSSDGLTEWVEPSRKTDKNQATHLVNQYIVKKNGKLRLFQEAIPNVERMWDLAADALEEVYLTRKAL